MLLEHEKRMLMTKNKIVNKTITQKQADEVRWTEEKTGIRNQLFIDTERRDFFFFSRKWNL